MYVLVSSYSSGNMGCDIAQNTKEVREWIEEFEESNGTLEERDGSTKKELKKILGDLNNGKNLSMDGSATVDLGNYEYLVIFHADNVGRFHDLLMAKQITIFEEA